MSIRRIYNQRSANLAIHASQVGAAIDEQPVVRLIAIALRRIGVFIGNRGFLLILFESFCLGLCNRCFAGELRKPFERSQRRIGPDALQIGMAVGKAAAPTTSWLSPPFLLHQQVEQRRTRPELLPSLAIQKIGISFSESLVAAAASSLRAPPRISGMA